MNVNTRHSTQYWVVLFAVVIFFFNTFLLPQGLSIAILFTPVWCYLLSVHRKLHIALAWLSFLPFYAVIHFINGVDTGYYLVSSAMIIFTVLFLVVCHYYINNTTVDWDKIFRYIVLLNFLFTILSLPLLFVSNMKPVVWYSVPVTEGIVIPRLKLFTEEASHYSFWFAPVAIYFYCRAIFSYPSKPFFTLLMITVPLLLSFSLGVLAGIAISGLVIFIVYFRAIINTKKKGFIFVGSIVMIISVLLVAYIVKPDNLLFTRLKYVFNGRDTSARGRTYEAFFLAHQIISQKSFLWGIGQGQLKLLGRNYIIVYYNYFDIPNVIRIPNACAETIVYFGYVGFAIRLLVESVLFFITKVYSDPYRLWLFVFVFIYQFTGSYITNIPEYIVWIFSFSQVFGNFINRSSQTAIKT